MSGLRLVVRGRVQGVGYRAWTIRQAAMLGLRGWARNRGDGTVEILAIGEAEAIEELARRCARGPLLARVEAVDREPAEDDGSPGFSQQPTG